MDRYKTGETVIFHGSQGEVLWFACPVFVVQDQADLVALYWSAGTPNLTPTGRPTPQDLLSNQQQELQPSYWTNNNVLMLVRPGAAHSIYAMWPEGSLDLLCWYVNLQAPLQRSRMGFSSMDHLLDLVISPDLSRWRWKDEDEFEQAIRIGYYTPEQAQAIRAEGQRVLDGRSGPDSLMIARWANWRPRDHWGIPQFPENFQGDEYANIG